MVYQFHNDALLILLFSTLLILGTLCFTQLLQPMPSEVHGLQNLTYLNIKDTSVQSSNANNNNVKSATLNMTNNGNVIEKISDKGLYRVQLRSNESFGYLPKKGFDMQILFLNASSASTQSNINNATIAGSQQQQMKQLVPVNGFDITIYSNNGKVLWQKTNQTINAATAFENVTFANGGYSGGITIQLTNIKISPVPIGTAIPLGSDKNIGALTGSFPTKKTQTDSVTFTASILK
jgi:hypothetical protein